ncbi:MAG: GtrA family protein [Pseudarcicella sp.]|nr:GtrA family protein [Pseudarcicella sp.]
MSRSELLNKKDILAYFLVAGSGVLVQLACSSLIQSWFAIPFQDSILPAYFISLIYGFFLTKIFAFNSRKSSQTRREMVKFLMVAMFSGFVTWFFASYTYEKSIAILDIQYYNIPYSRKKINLNELTCYLIGNGFSFLTNYFLHKTFTFKNTGFYNRLKTVLNKI